MIVVAFTLAAEGPVLVRRIADDGKIFVPGSERNDVIRNIGGLETVTALPEQMLTVSFPRQRPFILRSHTYQRNGREPLRGIHD